MKQSLSFYLTLLVIKLKGIKNDFSKDPIDINKIRKGDVHYPKNNFFRENHVSNFKVLDSLITEIKQEESSTNLLIFIHGGAFILGPSQHHWDTVKEIAKLTNYTIWMCDYPKAPEHKISEISNNIDAIYAKALQDYDSHKISLMGDSAGGTLVTALIQRLITENRDLPRKIILVSPVMDASMSNPEIVRVDTLDPMLSKKGVLSAKKMCVEKTDLKNRMISPLYGSFVGFPKTILFLAENDITYPDQKLVVDKLIAAKVDIQLVKGKNMPHIWPLLPIMKEAKVALREIIAILNK
ncbi:alpha/beta hydrolase [Cellulophaga sp. Hel_I_12]|uniref:alpha/beta hydrolase n=1 Tax=Cellulophaga sp. Hel_I_12 TaxID=1249972 RepID=UPI0006457579|nr:alpha/beta hydrolase [Cellulophaga sp. Hel_I_12]